MAGRIILFNVMLILSVASFPQQQKSFQEIEKLSYQYYMKGKWEKLILIVEDALDQEIDYYYLRTRAGIAYFQLERYQKAINHFKKAIDFNEIESLPIEYIYYSYLNLGKDGLASEAFKDLPVHIRDKLDTLYPQPVIKIRGETGPLLFNAEKKVENIDLDGTEDIYGEISYPVSGWYSNAYGAWTKNVTFRPLLAYTNVTVDNLQKAYESGNVLLDNTFRLHQNQIYIRLPVYAGKGWTFTPAFHWINLNYEYQKISFDETLGYLKTGEYVVQNDYLSYFSVERDMGYIVPKLFGSYATLNESEQIQVGLSILAYPFGNLKLYTITAFMDHLNNNDHALIFEQIIGVKLFKQVWSEAYITLGETRNYFNREGSMIYNFEDLLKMIGGARIQWFVSKNVELSLDYKILWREGSYITYQMENPDEETTNNILTSKYSFNTHLIIGGITWNF